MTGQVEQQPAGREDLLHIGVWTMALLLPGVFWILFGWLSCFYPLCVFLHIQKFGWRRTNRYLLIAIIASLVIGFLTRRLELIAFTILFLPAGYAVSQSVLREEKPWKAGLKCWFALVGIFTAFFGILTSMSEISFLQAISAAFDSGINQALEQYGKSSGLSEENYQTIESTLMQVKNTVPLILPAIFGSVLLLVSWITVVVGNAGLSRFGCQQVWPPYAYWKLPEQFVWVFIVFGITAVFTQGIIQNIGINFLILTVLIYSFQGLAIVVFYLIKLNVPKFMRVLIYIMIILQSFGTILLTIAGIADVWLDMRKANVKEQN